MLIFMPLVHITPIDDTASQSYMLLNPYLIKSAILIFGSWIALFCWSLSYRFKAFIHQSIGFKENESLFSLFLLLILTTAYIAIGDMTLLLKNTITYTITLSNGYFITSLLLLVGIVYTLRRGIMHAKRLSKAPILHSTSPEQQEEDDENFAQHISTPGGLF